ALQVFFHPGLQELHANHRDCRPGRSQSPGSRLLPERRPQVAKLREQYLAHVQKRLQWAAQSPAQAAAEAQAVLRIETDLAKGSLDRVARRDPSQTYHKMPVKELAALAPSIDWTKYF